MKENEKKTKSAANSSFYLALCICVLIVALIGYVSSLTSEKNEEPEMEIALETPAPIAQQPIAADIPKNTPKTVIKADEPEPAPVANDIIVEDEIPHFISPVNGKVLSEFSGEELVYHDAVSDWRTHDGVDLATELQQDVLASAAGVVEEVHSGSLGETILIDHGNGYKTRYANLAELPQVQAGDEVAQGDVIGKIGESALADCSPKAHLHFEILADGKNVNPSEYIE